MSSQIEISYKTIFFIIVLLLILWLLYLIKEIILMLFIAFILMAAFKPWVKYLEKYHIPKLLSVLIVYLLLIFFLVFAGSTIVPPLIFQSTRLGASLPDYFSRLVPFFKIDMEVFIQQIAPLGQNVLNITIKIFSDVIAIFTVLVISFYFLIERQYLESHLSGFINKKEALRFIMVLNKIEDRLGSWVRGQAMLMATIGVLTFISLTIIGIPYVLPLAIIAGVMEIIPIIGPILSAVPAVLIALTFSPILAVITALIYFIIQQFESQIIVPIVMKKAVGISPLITLVALMIGAKLAGVPGAILALPVVVMIEGIIGEYVKFKKQEE